jgi:hypothetical protein
MYKMLVSYALVNELFVSIKRVVLSLKIDEVD